MEGIGEKLGPFLGTISAYLSYFVVMIKKLLSLLRFSTGIDIIPDETGND